MFIFPGGYFHKKLSPSLNCAPVTLSLISGCISKLHHTVVSRRMVVVLQVETPLVSPFLSLSVSGKIRRKRSVSQGKHIFKQSMHELY